LRGCEQPSKTPQGPSQSGFPVCTGVGSQYQNQDHFLDAKPTAVRVRKMLCQRASIATEIEKKSDERDIRYEN
jgi:hypothetical protein